MKTVRVRIAVVINNLGDWAATGWYKGKDKEVESTAIGSLNAGGVNEIMYWVECDVPVPESKALKGEVVGSAPVPK